jgi:hypothetical protein
MPIIVKKEDPTTAPLVECENCGKTRAGRRVQVVGHVRESRGWYRFCFECWGPRVWWRRRGNDRKLWESPLT